MLWKLKLGALVALVALTVVVIFQNTEEVQTNFLFISFTMPRAALLLLTFLVGAAVGVLVAFIRPWRKKKSP